MTTPDEFRFGEADARDDMGGCCGKPTGCNIESQGCVHKVEKRKWREAADAEIADTAENGLAAGLRGLADDPHARAVLAKAFREAPLANAAEALHALADGLDAGTVLTPRVIPPEASAR